MRILQTWPRAA